MGLRRLYNPRYFALALPFFLLTFSGMLQSRIDLYAVNIFLTPTDVAQYQVFINFLLYLQAAAGFIMEPFVKSVYRLDYPAIRKISFRLALLGCLIVPPGLIALALLLTRLYEIHLPTGMYVWGALYVLPIYFYLPTIYALYKAEQQNTVITINFLGVGLNFALNLILLPRIGMEGAVISAALVSWLAFLIYLRSMRRLLQMAG
jgi:O-antigen/teichoic acid export membrane protein